jgi:predicted nicotinamide N-methyase
MLALPPSPCKDEEDCIALKWVTDSDTAGEECMSFSFSKLAKAPQAPSQRDEDDEFDPPFVLGGGLFSHEEDDNDDGLLLSSREMEEETRLGSQKTFLIAGERVEVRELGYSATNAAFVWPNGGRLASLLSTVPPSTTKSPPPRLLELGSGTGILAIFLRRKGWHVVTSDYSDDPAIQENISHNCRLNGVPHYHVPHTWGQPFPFDLLRACFQELGHPRHDVDIIVASDILLYAQQYDNLVATLLQIFRHSSDAKQRDKSTESNSLPGSEPRQLECATGLLLEGTTYQYPVFLLNIARRLKSTPLFFKKMEQEEKTPTPLE